ncbi:hypothetical protein BKA60DRAFT_547526 [Fusarium oxysporum]|nr:hypothetical protein BKA60DRAFT_547526 [Fusarium oxysporum]
MLFQWSEGAAFRKIAGKIRHSTAAELAACAENSSAELSWGIGAETHGPLVLDYLRPATITLPGADSERFAGVFHPPGSSALTYRHIVQEFRLYFDIPSAQSGASNAWDDIAFFPVGVQAGYMRTLEDTAPPPSGRLISGSSMDTAVITLPFDLSPQMMWNLSVIRMHLVRYVDCTLNLSEPLGVQIRGGCAQHISIPSVRRDPRYLPPNKPSSDPRFAGLPYHKTIRGTPGSQARYKSPKRPASSFASLTKEGPEGTDADMTNLFHIVSHLLQSILVYRIRKNPYLYLT